MPRPKIKLEDREHGLRSTYKAGCRCYSCRDAARAYELSYKRRDTTRRPDQAPREVSTPRECLSRYAENPERLAAVDDETVRALHDHAWRNYGPFRESCRCSETKEQREFLEAWTA